MFIYVLNDMFKSKYLFTFQWVNLYLKHLVIPTQRSANESRFTLESQAELLDSRFNIHRDQDVLLVDTVALRADSFNTPHRGSAGRSALEARVAHLQNILKSRS